MNSYLFINQHGLRLLQHFEGEPRLKARLCEGGRWELSYGVTFYPDGSPVKEGDTCTEDEALAMFRNALHVFEEVVRRHVKVPLTSNQFSAYVVFAYNVGEERFASSSVLRHINNSRFDDAADALGMWIYATLGAHKQAMRGLLRRQYATACLAMGYDFEVACADDAVAMVRERPPNNVGTDRVLSKTSFKDVLVIAQRYPLPSLDAPANPTPAPSPPAVADEVAQRQTVPAQAPAAGAASVIEKPSATVSGQAEAAPVAPTVPAPQPVPSARPAPAPVVLPSQVPKLPRLPDPPVPIGQQTSAVDAARKSEEWSNGTKAMWQSRRFYGLVLIMAGRLWMLKTGSNAFLGAVSDPLVMEFIGGFGVMIAGELVQSWGRAKAKRALH